MTPAEDLPAQASGKVEQKVIDFDRLEEEGLREGQWDVVFIVYVLKPFFSSQCLINACRMGTTSRNAGSRDNFTRIDREYVEYPSSDNPSSYFFFLRSTPFDTCLHYFG